MRPGRLDIRGHPRTPRTGLPLLEQGERHAVVGVAQEAFRSVYGVQGPKATFGLAVPEADGVEEGGLVVDRGSP